MPRSGYRPIALAAAVVLVGGCAPPTAVPATTPQVSVPASPHSPDATATAGASVGSLGPSASAAPYGTTGFSLTPEQATRVDLILRFVAYYNARRLEATISLFAPEASISDCDYSSGNVVQAAGGAGIRSWLQGRFSDHDTLVVGTIFNRNPDSDQAFGVSFAGRSSDTLAKLGRPDGIVPQLMAKVVFDSTGKLIAGFANGPAGASTAEIAQTCSAGGS